MTLFTPPYPPYDPTDKTGFSYETVVKRWPIILTKIIDLIHRENHELTMSWMKAGEGAEVDKPWEAQVDEGKGIIGKVGKLKYEMARDKELQFIVDDGEADVDTYNRELERLAESEKNTWFSCPWLYAECYLYRLLRSWFSTTKFWKHYDPFLPGKEDSFKASSVAIYKLAATMQEFEDSRDEIKGDKSKISVLFSEMSQMCLWGNATDLSLLTNLTHEDILKLQSVGKDAHEERKAFILHDDEKEAFVHLSEQSGARIDFVLDNAGFELFTDLVFADFLITYTHYVSKVVFHPKSIPWFVSDVTPPDFKSLFHAILSPTFFHSSAPSPEAVEQLTRMVHRWQSYLESGAFAMSVPGDTPLGQPNAMYDFWTAPYPYWEMESKAPSLFKSLKESQLVIFKGDLNYRKLTGDVRWPASTTVPEAIGPLAGVFPILSLRTSKADVVVGVDQTKADKLDASGEKWRVNGKYAMISFVPRSAS